MNQNGDDSYKVFISFKSSYQKMAEEFKRTLDFCGGDNITIHMSTDIPEGKNWREWIIEKMTDANMLILLFTAPRGTWDWCLYEVGLFRELPNLDRRPVVCVHNPKYPPPNPLKDLQAVKADVKGLERFLTKFYGGTEITKWHKPISKTFSENKDEVKRIAEKLSRTFIGGPPVITYINRYMIIEVKNAASITENSIPDENNLESNSRSYEIFGWVPGARKWQDIEDFAERKDETEWVEELKQAMYSAGKRNFPSQIKSTFHSFDNEKKYRPILYRVDYGESDDSMRFYLLFVVA